MASSPPPKPLPQIVLGRGPLVFEPFLDPTCPHSKRAFEKFRPLMAALGEDRLSLRIRFIVQPWHLFSAIVTRAVLAASATRAGVPAALRAMEGIYEHRENFEFGDDHASGPNMRRTPADILDEIGQLAGTDLTDAFRLPAVDRAMRWHARYARQNGIHVSPSFMIGGLVEPSIASSQPVEEWVATLSPHLE